MGAPAGPWALRENSSQFALSTARRKWCRVPQGGCGRLAAGIWDSVSLGVLRVEKVKAPRPLQESLRPRLAVPAFCLEQIRVPTFFS